MKHFKYFFAFLLLTVFLVTTGCSSISIRTAIEINAPKEDVYDVLADLDSYPEWNPYHKKIEGEFVEGADLTVYVLRPDGKKI